MLGLRVWLGGRVKYLPRLCLGVNLITSTEKTNQMEPFCGAGVEAFLDFHFLSPHILFSATIFLLTLRLWEYWQMDKTAQLEMRNLL